MGINSIDEIPKVVMENPNAEAPQPRRQPVPVFVCVRDGVRINFCQLNRHMIPVHNSTGSKSGNANAKLEVFHQVRLEHPKGDTKYIQSSGAGTYPFFPPKEIEAFESGAHVPILILTEGAKKALVASERGVHTLGLTSITHYRNAETGNLHPDILKFIEGCKVEHLVILWDGDCRAISQKALDRGEDLLNRPQGFYNALAAIRLLALQKVEGKRVAPRLKKISFMHVRSSCFPSAPKGLDDLLIHAEMAGSLNDVIAEMNVPESAKSFFYYNDITKGTAHLLDYFGLATPEAFYRLHSFQIGEDEWMFKKDIYQFDEADGKLQLKSASWQRDIVWVGDDFFEQVEEPLPDREGATKLTLKKRKVDTLKMQYGPKFFKEVRRYTGFTVQPSHLEYKESINGWRNLYAPIKHKPNPGECPHILGFIEHLFGTEAIEHKGKTIKGLDLGLDYCTLLYREPLLKLPVLILFSPENGTGKSTLFFIFEEIFGDNMSMVNNSAFESRFNGMFAGKLLIGCDETLLETQQAKERVKELATAKTSPIEKKGQDAHGMPTFAKYIFATNREKALPLTRHDERFWIRRVPVPEKKDPGLFEKMLSEIPAFLHLLSTREMATEKEDRMWFNPKLYLREDFLRMVKQNEPMVIRELRNHIQEIFEVNTTIAELRMDVKSIKTHFFSKKSWEVSYIREQIREHMNLSPGIKTERAKFVMLAGRENYEKGEYEDYLKSVEFIGRPIVFKREDFSA